MSSHNTQHYQKVELEQRFKYKQSQFFSFALFVFILQVLVGDISLVFIKSLKTVSGSS